MDFPSTSSGRSLSARGFSFTEVLFAVMILGIGFIMVAAIFPVAIQQARTTTEETTGAAVARGAANVLEKVASNSTMPVTNNVVVSANFDGVAAPAASGQPATNFTLAMALQGSAILGADTRYAWVPFYRRAGNPTDTSTWSPSAQVFMIPVLVRNESQFLGTPRIHDNAGQATIEVNIVNGVNGAPDTVTFKNPGDRNVPSEGAFMIIADVTGTGTVPSWDAVVAPELHGRIYRIGNPIPPGDPDALPDTWELMPGFDFEPIAVDADGDPLTGVAGKEFIVGDAPTETDDYRVFIVGRGVNPNDPGSATTPNREGSALDVAAYTTFVNVK